MESILLILLAVVFLAQIIMFTLFFLEKRSISRRFNTMFQYISVTVGGTIENYRSDANNALNAYRQETGEKIEDMDKIVTKIIDEMLPEIRTSIVKQGEKTDEWAEAVGKKITESRKDILYNFQSSLAERDKKMENRMNDLLLDYSQAQEAASKINDFGASLSRIFDYDPMEAIRKERERKAGNL